MQCPIQVAVPGGLGSLNPPQRLFCLSVWTFLYEYACSRTLPPPPSLRDFWNPPFWRFYFACQFENWRFLGTCLCETLNPPFLRNSWIPPRCLSVYKFLWTRLSEDPAPPPKKFLDPPLYSYTDFIYWVRSMFNILICFLTAGLLYWCDHNAEKMYSADLIGSSKKMLFELDSKADPFAVALRAGKLHWTDWKLRGLWTASTVGQDVTSIHSDMFTGLNDIYYYSRQMAPGTPVIASGNMFNAVGQFLEHRISYNWEYAILETN